MKVATQHVSLLNSSSPQPELAIATAARICYSKLDADEIKDGLSADEVQRILKIIIESGHHSALEHVNYTFSVGGVSRALTHQLVRHRMASYNQQSQRYVKYDDLEFIMPPSIVAQSFRQNGKSLMRYEIAMAHLEKAYQELVADGIEPEDARYLLPNATASKIVVTMNVRELFHFFELRMCNHAQWEIRELARAMYALVEPTAPYVFSFAGAACEFGSCRQSKPCGDPFERRKS